jgi:hypothetical protein
MSPRVSSKKQSTDSCVQSPVSVGRAQLAESIVFNHFKPLKELDRMLVPPI